MSGSSEATGGSSSAPTTQYQPDQFLTHMMQPGGDSSIAAIPGSSMATAPQPIAPAQINNGVQPNDTAITTRNIPTLFNQAVGSVLGTLGMQRPGAPGAATPQSLHATQNLSPP